MTAREQRRGTDIRQVIVDEIVASKVSTAALKKRAAVKRYLRQYFASVPVEDIQAVVFEQFLQLGQIGPYPCPVQ